MLLRVNIFLYRLNGLKIAQMVLAVILLFFMIDSYTISIFSLDKWIDDNVLVNVVAFFEHFQLIVLWDSKFVNHAITLLSHSLINK